MDTNFETSKEYDPELWPLAMILVFFPIIGCILLGPLIAYVTRRPASQPGMSHITPPNPFVSDAGTGPHAVIVHPNQNQTSTSHHGTPVGSTPVTINANDVDLEAALPAGTPHGGGCCIHGAKVGQRFGLDGEVEFCQEPLTYGTM